MGDTSILSVRKQLDGKGEFYKILAVIEGNLVTCFLRTDMERRDLLLRLAGLKTLQDLYRIDQKAVLYSA